MEKPIVSDKNVLFAQVTTECHHIRVAPDREEYLKVWVKEPTWLMVENFVEKTEPQLSGIELLRLSPYVGGQLKEILPNPFTDLMEDDLGNE
jgi:hypothetical protein